VSAFLRASGGSDSGRSANPCSAWMAKTGSSRVRRFWTNLTGNIPTWGLCLGPNGSGRPEAPRPDHVHVAMRSPGVCCQSGPIPPKCRTNPSSTKFSSIMCGFSDRFRIGAVNDGWKVALTTLGQETLDRCATLTFIEMAAYSEDRPEQSERSTTNRPLRMGRIPRESRPKCWLNTFGVAAHGPIAVKTARAGGAVPGPEESWAKNHHYGPRPALGHCGDGHAGRNEAA